MARTHPSSSSDGPLPRHAAKQTAVPPRRSRRYVVLLVVGVAAALGLATTALALRAGTAGGDTAAACADARRVLDVAAAPEIAPVLAAATGRGSERLLRDAAECLEVRVTPRRPAEIAATLRAGDRVGSDVWVPDSSSWLSTLPADDRPRSLLSLATSPVVLAVNRSSAERLGWPARPLDLAGALTGQGPQPQRLGLSPLDGSATARLGVLEISRRLSTLPEGHAALARTLRSADGSLAEEPAAVLERVQAGPSLAAPAAEQAVWAHSAAADAPPVVAAYSAVTSVLDYPLVPLSDDREEDLAALQRALSTAEWPQRVQAAGFRSADGVPGDVLTTDRGVDGRAAASAPVADPAALEAALQTYDVLTRDTRMLAVLDVSGSMAQSVPGLDGTRMDLATDAAGRGLGLLEDDAHIGLWIFSTDLTASADHRELVPIGPLGPRSGGSSGREALGAALADVRYIPDGDTGLYDTVLAAVRHVRQGWDPDRVNSVVVLTDGRNDDADGIGLEQLLTTLQAEQGQRPVPVITVAYGPDTDVAVLRRIGEATGGSVYVSQDPRRIHEVLQDALSRRSCRPGC